VIARLLAATLASGALMLSPHASADNQHQTFDPQAGPKICAHHGVGPGLIYKAACGVGSWGAPTLPASSRKGV